MNPWSVNVQMTTPYSLMRNLPKHVSLCVSNTYSNIEFGVEEATQANTEEASLVTTMYNTGKH